MSLRGQFLRFHYGNPWVYDRLVEICYQLLERGFNFYSMRTLISVLRFEWDLKTGGDVVHLGGGEELHVKLNDHHSPYYARLIAYKHRCFEDFFEYRRVEGERYGEVILFSDVPGEPDVPKGSLRRLRWGIRRPMKERSK